MGLKTGQKVPTFKLPSTEGKDVSDKDLMGQAYILYFYPKDYTPGCTAEACSFRDEFQHFRDLDITIYGVSTDSIETHHKFRKDHKLPFHLLSDLDGKVIKKFDARVPVLGLTKRITYLINEEGKVAASFNNMLNAKKHIKEMLKVVKPT